MANDAGAPLVLPSGRFAGREAFAQLVRDFLEAAVQQGWRELILSDASFEGWPLHERVVSESLHAWSRPGRRFVMLASRYDAVLRYQPRFVSWRKTWSHIIDCRVCHQVDPADFPSMVWSPAWVLRRLDVFRSAGVCGAEPERRVHARETLEELQRNGTPGFPASTLGL